MFDYKFAVLEDVSSTGKRFAFDRGSLFRVAAVGGILAEGTFTTPEVVAGGEMRTPLYIPLRQLRCTATQFVDNSEGTTKIYPTVSSSGISLPLFKSDNTGILEPDCVKVGFTEEYTPITNWAIEEVPACYSEIAVDSQDSSICHLPKDYIVVLAGDTDLYETRAASGRPVIQPITYFVMRLDLNGIEYLSWDYLDMKLKYTTFCKIGKFGMKGMKDYQKMGAYFDYCYMNRERIIYKPYYKSFIKETDSTSL